MLINSKSTLTLSGILVIALLETMAWGEAVSPDRVPVQAYSVSSEIRPLPGPISGGKSGSSGSGAVVNLSEQGTPEAAFGDGRIGFWIIGILINLSVLGWFLLWAFKEWRKKGDD